MGIFDDVQKEAGKLAEDHPEQAEQLSDTVINKGGSLADNLTGDKYDDQIKQAEQKADDAI